MFMPIAQKLLFGTVIVSLAIGRAAAAPAHTLDISDRVPKFEKFYADAQGLDEAARWALWKKEYGIAAVPPTPEGDTMARAQLDAAWTNYAALIPRLPAMEAGAERAAHDLFAAVNKLYATGPVVIHTRVVLFVGQFDGNEYTVPPMGGQPATVVMPVENPALKLQLAHEMSHSVHFQIADVKNSFGAPIGETIFLEGLAMHAAKALVPGLPDASYTELTSEPGWLARCSANKAAVMTGILPNLNKAGPDVATKFTFGKGTTGMDRELYCAGWFVVGKLLASGTSFPKLARIPEDKMIAIVRQAMTAR
jgi:hypothetical protein